MPTVVRIEKKIEKQNSSKRREFLKWGNNVLMSKDRYNN